jgi:hypothetical protein
MEKLFKNSSKIFTLKFIIFNKNWFFIQKVINNYTFILQIIKTINIFNLNSKSIY